MKTPRNLLGYPDTTAMVVEVTARNSESVIGIAAVVFAARPLVTLAILVGPVIELPALLVLTKVMLQLRTRWTWPNAARDARGSDSGVTLSRAQ